MPGQEPPHGTRVRAGSPRLSFSAKSVRGTDVEVNQPSIAGEDVVGCEDVLGASKGALGGKSGG